MSELRRLLEASYRHAISATDPGRLVRSQLPDERPALVLAVGKAALPMVAEAREAYGDVAWLATPPAAAGDGEDPRVLPGAHPLPDASSVRAAAAALAAVARLSAEDLLLVLVSGGGSALWCAPSGIDLVAKRALTLALQRAGADIHELNVVRRHLSRIKGGRLAAATEARVRTLALSDVPGDDLVDIASGPSVPDPTTFADALAVLRRFAVAAPSAAEHLSRGVAGEVAASPQPGGEVAARCSAEVIGSAAKLLAAAESFWTERGHVVVVLSDRLQGEASELARAHAELVLALRAGADPRPAAARLLPDDAERQRVAFDRLDGWLAGADGGRPLVLLSGGEATVTVTGSGRGGRNLEFAAWLLAHLRSQQGGDDRGGHRGDLGIWALSAGSDGVDGSSDAAGAFLTPDSSARVSERGLDLRRFLVDNDTDAFFALLDDRFVPGPTGNNLNDYRALVVTASH